MPSKLYELRPFKGRREITVAGRLLETLDFDHPELAKDLLRRHLLAVAERDGVNRRDAHLYHLYHLDVHEYRNGTPERGVLTSFALPVEV